MDDIVDEHENEIHDEDEEEEELLGLNNSDVSGADGGDWTQGEDLAQDPGSIDIDDQDSNDVASTYGSELEAIKDRVREMEQEAVRLKHVQNEVDRFMQGGSGSQGAPKEPLDPSSPGDNSGGPPNAPFPMSIEEKLEADGRSIYVGNVDYGATAEELEQHFRGVGGINRVTISCNKYDGRPKGFAYIEFADRESVTTAMALDESLFRGRQIKVMIKRTNRPGLSTTDRPPRGSPALRRGRGRGGRFSGGYGGYSSNYRGFTRRGGRIMMSSNRGSSYYSPY